MDDQPLAGGPATRPIFHWQGLWITSPTFSCTRKKAGARHSKHPRIASRSAARPDVRHRFMTSERQGIGRAPPAPWQASIQAAGANGKANAPLWQNALGDRRPMTWFRVLLSRSPGPSDGSGGGGRGRVGRPRPAVAGRPRIPPQDSTRAGRPGERLVLNDVKSLALCMSGTISLW